jgi:hypothetical protein
MHTRLPAQLIVAMRAPTGVPMSSTSAQMSTAASDVVFRLRPQHPNVSPKPCRPELRTLGDRLKAFYPLPTVREACFDTAVCETFMAFAIDSKVSLRSPQLGITSSALGRAALKEGIASHLADSSASRGNSSRRTSGMRSLR